MEKEKFHKNAYDMIYLTRCAMDGKKPDPKHLQDLNLEELFEVCEKHTMTACVAYALESAGIRDNRFSQAKEKSIRKNVLLDADRKKVLSRLEQEKIWYMPLKGAIMKDWYPKLGMRQMSDNDILYDGAYREKVRDIMLEIGFTCEHFGTGHDDSYYKQPVSNFEMHHALFSVSHAGKAYDYYKDVKERLLKDETNEYGYHFSIEDFYIYMTAHEYRHYENRGTGVRSLLDTYVFVKKYGDTVDWDYITAEMQKLEMADYEQESRQLAMKLFSGQDISQTEQEMLDIYILSGVYGSMEQLVERRFSRNQSDSKAVYIFHRLFPSMNQIKVYHPFFYRHKWLIPVLWVYRPIHGVVAKRKMVSEEIQYLFKK